MYGLKHLRDVQAGEQGFLVKTTLDLDTASASTGCVIPGDGCTSLSLSFPAWVSQCIVMTQGDVMARKLLLRLQGTAATYSWSWHASVQEGRLMGRRPGKKAVRGEIRYMGSRRHLPGLESQL